MSIRIFRLIASWLVVALCLGLHAQRADAAEYKVLHQFCPDDACLDGFTLAAPLVRDPNGNLYGTARQGGKFSSGTIFRLSPTATGEWKFEKLHDFCHE